MITELTPEQRAQLPVFKDKWLAHGLSTKPADRKLAERGIKLAYEAANLPAPPAIYWVSSPIGALKKLKELDPKANLKDHINNFCYGLHDSFWLGFYDYFREVLNMKDITKPLEGLTMIAQAAGWFLPYDECVIISDRPEFIAVDTDKKLHCAYGMAIRYRDGFGLYMWHGIKVDEKIILHPEELTIHDWQNEKNAEIRRIIVERMGYEKFLSSTNAKLIAEDDLGKLWKIDMGQSIRPLMLVEVINSTAEPDGTFKKYFLSVNERTKTPKEGIAASFSFPTGKVDEYKPAIET